MAKVDLSRFAGRFRQETRDNLTDFDKAMLSLERHSDGGESFDEAMRELMRLTHAIKGGARMIGFTAVNRLTHSLEEFLISLRKQGRAGPGEIDLIAESRSAIDRLLFERAEESPDLPDWTLVLFERLAGNSGPERKTLTSGADDTSTGIAPEGPGRPPEAAVPIATSSRRVDESTVRVDIDALDDILLYGRELSESLDGLRQSQSQIERLSRRIEDEGVLQPDRLAHELSRIAIGLRERIADVDRAMRQIDSGAVELRMRPLSELLEVIPLQARELARALGKEVEVEFTGESVRLDGRIVELLREPLLHIVRNALDHGIEPPDEREKAGKPRRGQLTVGGFEIAGWARLVIADDGGGLNLDQILKRAIELGIAARDALLSPGDVRGLLFDERFTSRRVASDVSGRGVGLAAVRRRIKELRGDVSIDGSPGLGTRIVLQVPTSLSSQRALIVALRGLGDAPDDLRYFGLPTALVRETTRHGIAALEEADSSGPSFMLHPPVSLAALLEGTPLPARAHEAYHLICTDGLNSGTLAVHKIIAETEMIVHPLPEIARGAELIAGAAALGNDEMLLLLNVPKLLAALTATGQVPSAA
ncbi:MAG: hypothetical protein FJY67_01100 [Calditrichaeota bacterium]|nr:hypothetical protein [Calditrichota bacterium]